jgi:hypothetical protein
MQFNAKVNSFVNIKKNHPFESKLFIQVCTTLLIMVSLEAVFLQYREGDFYTKEFLLDIYLTLSVVIVTGAIRHLKSYGSDFKSTHLGMMTGMTLGMQTGMMVGIILGATNGFFVGAVITMIVAAIIGAIGGACSGVAGILEGLMAGSMGGIMGAMTGAMLQDDLFWFMPPFMILNFIIMIGLVYMVHKEAIENNYISQKSPTKLFQFVLLNFILLSLLTLVVNLFPESNIGDLSQMYH